MATPKKSSTSSPARRASTKPASKPAEAAEDVALPKTTKPRRTDATSAAPKRTRSRVERPSDSELVRERAYLLAESNGFAGDPDFYWSIAERELTFSGPSAASSEPSKTPRAPREPSS